MVSWLSADAIIEINKIIVEETCEPHVLLSLASLEGAAHRAINIYQYDEVDDPIILSVALLEGLAKDHPFLQGNKRTALRAALTMMKLNGIDIRLPDTEVVAEFIQDVILGRQHPKLLVAFFRAQILS